MIRQSIQSLLIMLIVGISPTGAIGETTIIAGADQSDWNAIGRVNKGGFNSLTTCTGTLIAADLVMTAAHCLPRQNPTPEALADYVFVAGWNRGEYAAVASFAEIYLHPDNMPEDLKMENIHADVAIVRLTAPIPADVVTPITLGELPEIDVPLAFIGYRNARKHAPELIDGCPFTEPRGSLILVACAVHSGQSGSPLLDMTPVGPRIVGMISAKSGNKAIAVALDNRTRAFFP